MTPGGIAVDRDGNISISKNTSVTQLKGLAKGYINHGDGTVSKKIDLFFSFIHFLDNMALLLMY